MPHYLIAFAAMLAASVCFVFSYSFYRKSNFQTAALFIMLAGFILRFFVSSDLFLHEWDERYHALVAKNLMDNLFSPRLYPVPLLPYDYRDWSSGFIWLHKQPLPLWCMAISMKFFGVNEIALRLPSVLISTSAIYLTYYIGKNLVTERTGLLAAFFQAVNGLVLEITGGRVATDHIDIFFLFFIELAIVFAILYRQKPRMLVNVLTGICIGLAVLCKWLPAFIVVPVWLALNHNKHERVKIVLSLLVILTSALVIFMPWQLYAHWKFPMEYGNEMLHNFRHIVEVLDGNGGGFFYFFDKLFISVNEFIWLAVIWFLYKAFASPKGRIVDYRLALLVWIILPFIFFSIAKTKMQGYLLFTYPAFFIILAEFCEFLLTQTQNNSRNLIQKLAFIVLVSLSVRYSVERIKPLQDQSKQLSWADEFKKMNGQSGKKVYFNVKHCIEGMFYTNFVMYGWTPGSEQLDELRARGYEVVINQNPEL